MNAIRIPGGRLLAFQVFSFIVIVTAWHIGFQDAESRQFLPSPAGVWHAAVQYIGDGSLLSATRGSLGRVLLGFVAAAILGVGFGLSMGFIPVVRRALMPILEAMRAIAPIAWIPLAVVWFGITGTASIFIVAYSAFFPFVVNTAHGISHLDQRLLQAARSLGAPPLRISYMVVLPAILPVLILASRLSMGAAWGAIIAAEMAMGVKLSGGEVASEGLGQLMIRTLYVKRDINALVVFLLTIGVVALLVDSIFRLVDRRIKWSSVA